MDKKNSQLLGYLFRVSPIKTASSGKCYFEAKVQINEKAYRRVISSKPQQREQFLDMDGQSLILDGLNFSKSKSEDYIYGFYVSIKRYGVLDFVPVEPEEETVTAGKCVDIAWGLSGSLVNIHGKVVSFGDKKFVPIGSREVPLEVVISDDTRVCQVTLWGDNVRNVKLNTCCDFEELKTVQLNGKIKHHSIDCRTEEIF